MIRYGQIIQVKPEKLEIYKKLHAAVWPDVLAMITACNIRNYSIFYRDGQLFAYFEYHGSDFCCRYGQDGCRSDHPAVVG